MSDDQLQRLRSGLAGRFAIERELGHGGMASVYLARDLKLGRLVAVKVLRPDLAAALGAERFLREIQIAANLSHPHIVQLYDSAEVEGQLLYVMPFIEGESLRQRLDREGPLAVSEAVAIATGVAGALDYAHHQGIVHRDIKPENILLHTGQAMVTDFGIARAVDAAADSGAGATALTSTGVLIGTPLYMSPEQVVGDPVDARTDVYALGCVLYEMLTGTPPYTGTTAQAVLARHAVEPVPSVRSHRPEVPVAVERTVAKALAKTPAERFSSAAELRQALTGAAPAPRPRRSFLHGHGRLAVSILTVLVLAGAFWTAFRRKAAAGVPSVAVLPFANQSGSADDDYFAEGITVELINALGRVPGLHVTGRTSAFALPRTGLDSKTIGQRLNAALLLEATVQRAGDRVRVTAELIDAASGIVKWSDSYSQEVRDILSVEDSISQAIVSALRIQLVGGHRSLVARGTANPEAHDLYLKGRYFLNQRGAGAPALVRAIAFFQQALALDSNYAQAWAGLAQAYGFQVGFGSTPPGEAFALAKAAALRAVELDNDIALAHTSLGFIAIFHDWDWEAARRELDLALALDSTDPATHLYRAWYFRSQGRLDQALAEMRTAQQLDPLNQIFNARVGTILAEMHRYSDAETELRQALTLDSTNAEARGDLAQVLTLQGRYAEALANMEIDTADLHPFPRTAYLGYAYGRAGRRADALAVQRRLERHKRQRYITPETFAFVAIGLKDTTAALDWLERGYRERSFFLWAIASDPVFEPLHQSARFQHLVQEIGLVTPQIPPVR
jgi:TolB-like protein/Tfp pilus assembly protein PilF